MRQAFSQPSTPPLSKESAETLVDRFEQIALSHADRIAVVCNDLRFTYAELNFAANRVAHRLLALDLPQQSIVALWLDRSIESISAILGILKAGHIYLPIEATYPGAHVAQTLLDAQPAALISQPSLAAILPEIATPILFLGEAGSSIHPNPRRPGLSDPIAYIIYTSGSTGRPKGVVVSHANVIRLFGNTIQRFAFNEDDVWTMFHSLAFDFSVWEIWGALLTGARLVVVPFETTRSPEDFYRLLSTERVTVLNQTPSAFALIDRVEEHCPQLPLALRLVIFGGEALNFSSLRSWYTRHAESEPQLFNCYGITETTVHVTIRAVSSQDAQTESESLIGEPIPDLQIHLLDSSGAPVPDGEIGELCVGGAGVAQGYLNRPELTQERFISDPFSPSGKLYRSGDLARRRADGELVYAGRRDEQVKINGFRIELGEVEAALAKYPCISQVCITPYTDPAGRAHLAAYLVTVGGISVELPALTTYLARTLPVQMLPTFYTRLNILPLTANGKVDRKALPTPSDEISLAGPAARQPQSPIEESVLALVRETIGIPGITLDDNFFTSGGHSLLATQFVMRARAAYEIKITLRDLFEAETVADLAARIESLILEDIENLTEEDAIRLTKGETA